jgi:hypothetical protein
MSKVKADMPPSTRRMAVSERDAWPAGFIGSGAMDISGFAVRLAVG